MTRWDLARSGTMGSHILVGAAHAVEQQERAPMPRLHVVHPDVVDAEARHGYSITPSFPLWLPIYQSRHWASTAIFLTPAFAVGILNTRISAVLGSRRTIVSAENSFTHTAPLPSTLTA